MKIQKLDRVEALNATCRFILILEYIPLTLPFPLTLSSAQCIVIYVGGLNRISRIFTLSCYYFSVRKQIQ